MECFQLYGNIQLGPFHRLKNFVSSERIWQSGISDFSDSKHDKRTFFLAFSSNNFQLWSTLFRFCALKSWNKVRLHGLKLELGTQVGVGVYFGRFGPFQSNFPVNFKSNFMCNFYFYFFAISPWLVKGLQHRLFCSQSLNLKVGLSK